MKKRLLLAIGLFVFLSLEASALNIDQVRKHVFEGDYKAAIVEGEKALAQVSEDSPVVDELHYLMGACYLREGHLTRASDIFEIIINEHKNSRFYQDARMGLGDVYFLRGHFSKAVPIYQKILKEDPATEIKSRLYYRLGRFVFTTGDLEEGKVYVSDMQKPAPPALPPESKEKKNAYVLLENKEGYSLQVGAFSQEKNARDLAEQLNKKNYPVYIEEIKGPGKIKFRVKVGRFKDKAGALKQQSRLSGEGYSTIICPPFSSNP
ncbi:MAG: SPOR domain-containing protein [Deltaproteobacteria bacterium]|nr:SPOR domain-containing protein [Deltaproteobacteria bacterium]